MKHIILVIATVAALILTGCGHNAIVYSDGIGVQFGVDPEHFSASFNLRYGKILTAAVRDVTELEMKGEAQGGTETAAPANASATTQSGVSFKIGRQVNGYARELIEAGATAEQIRALLESAPKTE